MLPRNPLPQLIPPRITEAKYGFTCQQGSIQLSLVRSALVTEAGSQLELRRVSADSDYSDIGRHLIRVAVGRYSAVTAMGKGRPGTVIKVQ